MRRSALLAGAAALLGAVLYFDSLPNGFVFDDRPIVERNRQIRSLRNLPEIFRTPYRRYFGCDSKDRALYRPLTIATFAFDRAVTGTSPVGFHATNVVLHALASGLVVLVALELGLAPLVALGGGLLFAAHPVHTEAVAGLVGRSELLAALFFLVALAAYVQARREHPAGRGLLVLAAASFFLALLSKESAIALPLVVLAWEWLFRRGSTLRDRLGPLACLAVPVALYLLLRAHVLSTAETIAPCSSEILDNPLLGRSTGVRVLSALAVASRYATLLAFPWRLSPDYSHAQIPPVETPFDPRFLAGTLLAVALGVLALGQARRRPAMSFLALFGVLTFAIVSNLGFPIGTIMAERLLYLPSVGFCLLLASVFPFLRRRLGAGAALAVGVVVVGAFSARTIARNLDWRSDYTLFSSAARTSPESAKVLNNLGAELLKRGEHGPALELFTRARAIAPDWAQVHVNLAQAYLAASVPLRAEEEAREAVRLLPADPLPHVKLAEVLEAQERLEEAERELEAAIALDPEDADARLRLGTIAAGRRDLPKAERELAKAVELDPGSVVARTSLAFLYWQTRRPDRAVAELREAVRLDPASPQARNNLGNALRDAGSIDESIRELERAIALDGRFAPSHYNLGLTFEKAGRLDEARAQYRRALEIDPAHGGSLRAMSRLGS